MQKLLSAAVGTLGGRFLTALMRTTRSELIHGHDVEAEFIEKRRPVVYVLWHGRLLPCAYRYRNREFGTLISQNRDGDYISREIGRWGYRVIRGSSSRGAGAAVRNIVRMLQSGTAVALTPDGPRGPRQKMKIGPLRAAQKAGVPVVPVSGGATRAWYFGSWDRFLVPKPFTWMPTALGEPISIDPDADDEALEVVAEQIERTLDRLTRMTDEAASERRR